MIVSTCRHAALASPHPPTIRLRFLRHPFVPHLCTPISPTLFRSDPYAPRPCHRGVRSSESHHPVIRGRSADGASRGHCVAEVEIRPPRTNKRYQSYQFVGPVFRDIGYPGYTLRINLL